MFQLEPDRSTPGRSTHNTRPQVESDVYITTDELVAARPREMSSVERGGMDGWMVRRREPAGSDRF